MPGKRIQFDEETWAAVDLLARDSMRDFQELAEEAFRDLLAKHNRPVTLKDQLRKSISTSSESAAGASARPSHRKRPQGRRPTSPRPR
jgi:hypothetical protein